MEINVINFNKNQLKWIVSVASRVEFLNWNVVVGRGRRLGEGIICVLRTKRVQRIYTVGRRRRRWTETEKEFPIKRYARNGHQKRNTSRYKFFRFRNSDFSESDVGRASSLQWNIKPRNMIRTQRVIALVMIIACCVSPLHSRYRHPEHVRENKSFSTNEHATITWALETATTNNIPALSKGQHIIRDERHISRNLAVKM